MSSFSTVLLLDRTAFKMLNSCSLDKDENSVAIVLKMIRESLENTGILLIQKCTISDSDRTRACFESATFERMYCERSCWLVSLATRKEMTSDNENPSTTIRWDDWERALTIMACRYPIRYYSMKHLSHQVLKVPLSGVAVFTWLHKWKGTKNWVDGADWGPDIKIRDLPELR